MLMVPLTNFKIEDYQLGNTLFKNGKDEILAVVTNEAHQLLTKGYVEAIGEILTENISNNYVSILNSGTDNLTPDERAEQLFHFHFRNEMFCLALWFVKDHSIGLPFATAHTLDGDKNKVGIKYSGISSTKANGEIEETTFTLENLKDASEWFDIIYENHLRKPNNVSEKSSVKANKDTNESLNFYEEGSSLSRAFLYLAMARRETFLPSKIALYITILENLFAVKGDNTHSVGERVTIFVSENDEDNMEIYNKIKKAYNLRSNYVHGTHVKHNNKDQIKNIQDLSIRLDEYVRKSIKKIVYDYPSLNYTSKKTDKNFDFDATNKFFIELILRRKN